MATLGELAQTLRSKNAGVNQVHIRHIFPDQETYSGVLRSGAVTRETGMRRLFGISPETDLRLRYL